MKAHVDYEAWKKKQKIKRIVWCTVICVLLVAGVTLFLLRNRILPAIRYSRAETEWNLGHTEEAIDRFSLLGTYRDAAVRAAVLAYGAEGNDVLYEQLRDAKPGDVVSFGRYEQDNNERNGAEPISWIVIRRENGRLLLLSQKILDGQPYHTEKESVTWEKSSLRTWLNGTFPETAFTESERALLAKTRHENPDNPASYSEGGRDTEDKVFIFSFNDLLTNLRDCTFLNSLSACATAYAKAQGVETSESEAACWWIRTPGYDESSAVFCSMDGQPLYSSRVNRTNMGVRPVVWIFAPDGQ